MLRSRKVSEVSTGEAIPGFFHNYLKEMYFCILEPPLHEKSQNSFVDHGIELISNSMGNAFLAKLQKIQQSSILKKAPICVHQPNCWHASGSGCRLHISSNMYPTERTVVSSSYLWVSSRWLCPLFH